MRTNTDPVDLRKADKTFTLSVSNDCYAEKPTAPWKITYSSRDITVDDLERFTKEGRSFCYTFNCSDPSKITQQDKHKDTFASTEAIFFDLDKMFVPMDEYIAGLPYKPTIGYTTYSNGKNGRYGYRLVYIFDDKFTSEVSFNEIYDAIANANGFVEEVDNAGQKYGFDRRPVNQQYYGGGCNSKTYKSYTVYSIDDFAEFTSSSSDVFFSGDNDGSPFENNDKKEYTYCSPVDTTDNVREFWKDFRSMRSQPFIDKYLPTFHEEYYASLASRLILSDDKMYYTYPEDYQEVLRNWQSLPEGRRVVRWQVGQDRKKKLYITAQVMKHNLPDITLEELVFNLLFERQCYYDNSDIKLTNEVVLGIAQNALRKTFHLGKCKHPSYSINKEYWMTQNVGGNAAKQIVKKTITDKAVFKFYDPNKSVDDNLAVLKGNDVKIGRSRLFEFKKEYQPVYAFLEFLELFATAAPLVVKSIRTGSVSV